jgi:2-keto-3-deoxy-L-rhamnonate aldolase RhmA
MAMNGTETIPIVRIPSANPVFIQRALDIGGMGVLVPMVKTADEAQAIVDATRYPPQGRRGWGPLRASQYTVDNEDYFNRANDNILVFLLIETEEAVENLEAIGAVPGVDVLYIGMWDLCLSMGLNPLHMPFPETDAVIERALEVGREVGVAIGFGESTPEGLQRRQAQGFTVLGYGPDYYLLLQAARAGLEVFKRS